MSKPPGKPGPSIFCQTKKDAYDRVAWFLDPKVAPKYLTFLVTEWFCLICEKLHL